MAILEYAVRHPFDVNTIRMSCLLVNVFSLVNLFHPCRTSVNFTAMGKADKALVAFINAIPDDKLTAIPTNTGTLYRDTDFRLDMQGVRSRLSPNIHSHVLRLTRTRNR